MPKCPNCFFELNLHEHRRKYKCSRCRRWFLQSEIDTKDFQKFNKQERIKDKEVIEVNEGKKYKQPKLTEFEKKQNSLASSIRYYEKNRDLILSKQKEYRAKSGQARRNRLKELYNENIDIERLRALVKYWKKRQFLLALKTSSDEAYRGYKGSLGETLPTFALADLLITLWS